ncbi:MAG TPA: hypothetical protein V6D33_12465 [Cyanophyceae cyanobacterium]
MIRSGRHPLYHYRCQHPQWKDEISDSRTIGDSDRTPSWCPFLPKVIPPPVEDKVITEEWLKAKGFRPVAHRNDERTKPDVKLRRLAICGKGETENMFTSPDDLCIDIAPNPVAGDWYVWLHQEDPYRFIHIRQFRYQHDLERFYEALTGVPLKEARSRGTTTK